MSDKPLHEQIEEVHKLIVKINTEQERMNLKINATFAAFMEVLGLSEKHRADIDLFSAQIYTQSLQAEIDEQNKIQEANR